MSATNLKSYLLLLILYLTIASSVIVVAAHLIGMAVMAVRSERIILAQHALNILTNNLADGFERRVENVLTLAMDPKLTRLLSGEFFGECEGSKLVQCQKSAMTDVSYYFEKYININNEYFKVRIVDTHGQEILKMRQKNGIIVAGKKPSRIRLLGDNQEEENAEKLQDVSGRYYFKDAINLKAGEVFVSSFDGNVEQGKIELPFLPTIRLSTPIVKDDKRVGLVIVSVDGHKVMHLIDALAERNPGLQILNKDGYWLFRQDGKYLFDFMFQKDNTLAKYFPGLGNAMGNATEGVVDHDGGLFIFRKFDPFPANLKQAPFSETSTQKPVFFAKTKDFPWNIVVQVSREEINSWGSKERDSILWFTMVVEFLLALVTLLSMRWLRRQYLEKKEQIANQRILVTRLGISSLMEIALEPLDLESTLNKGLEIILSVPWLPMEKKGAIFLADDHTQSLAMATHMNLESEVLDRCRRVSYGTCLCGRAASSKKTIFASHVDDRHEVTFPGMEPHGHYCLPIVASDRLLGILNVYVGSNYENNPEEEAFLTTAANALAGIIERKQMEMEREKDLLSIQHINQVETLAFQSVPLTIKIERIIESILENPWLDHITGGLIFIQECREGAPPKVFSKKRHASLVCPCMDMADNHGECLKKLKAKTPEQSPGFSIMDSPCALGGEHMRLGLFTCEAFDAMICLTIDATVTKHRRLSEKATQAIHSIRRILAETLMQEHNTEQILKFKRAVEQNTAAVVITDLSGKIEYVNEKFVQVSGYSTAEVMGKSPRILKSGLIPQSVYQEMWQNLVSGKSWAGELCNRRKDGSLYWESVLISPVANQEGETTHFIAIKEDVSNKKKESEERQQLERQLRQAQKMEALGHLTGGIAHDFNNILTAIKGYSELAIIRFAKDETSKLYQYLQNILTASDRARDLIAQMMSFSRTHETEVKRVSLAPLIKEVIKLVRATLPASISIPVVVESQDIAINADPIQLHQTIMNLFVNARDAMAGKGRVDVHVKVDHQGEILKCSSCHTSFYSKDLVVLVVKDDGPGIPHDLQEKIFQPFFTTKEVGQGTGMGLSVIHGIVHSTGGHIVLVSSPGKGAAFHLYFPSCETQPVESRMVDILRKVQTSIQGRILLVDDEVAILEFLKEVLGDEGLSVTAKSSSVEALSWLQADPHRVDVVISDQTMPEMTGIEMIQKIKSIRPDLPVILCTGFSRDINADNAASLGVDHFMTKPMDMTILMGTLRSVLSKAAASVSSSIARE